MALLVLKFGGTSVAGIAEIGNAAAKVAAEVARGHQVAVVVSAMSGVTNRLVGYCNQIDALHDPREYDAVVSAGENITSGLMALTLQKLGLDARSWQGWQVPLISNDTHGKARIVDIQVGAMRDAIAAGEVAVLAGFQGVSAAGRITTLGRGGSDTSAVALAAALRADRCDIYTDVDGVYTADPRIVAKARKLRTISYEEMLEMASVGAKVLHSRSVEVAMYWHVPLQVLSTFKEAVGSDLPGTMVLDEEKIMEQGTVSGVTLARDEAKIMLLNLPDRPGIAAGVFGPIAEAAVNVDMIVQNNSHDGRTSDITFTIVNTDLARVVNVLRNAPDLKDIEIRADEGVVKVSVVGIGMRSNPGIARVVFETLAEKGINIQVISASEIKISVLIAEEYAELAVRSLHTAFSLEAEK